MFGGTNAQPLREPAVTLAGMQNVMREVAQARQESGLPPVPIRVITAGRRPRMPRAHLEHLNADRRDCPRVPGRCETGPAEVSE
ncbi:hypothetical protein SAMN05216276_11176 [Streptosporangium subroseum]|uniref:Uncharacterized protein n=1 Tax=Streptosporangium subroseum TaxID=106412 RepID=A0A239PB86_9ACTN|nr:hypothetical protein [Streptosporangium subroseum]SNT64367.1 hypothetical protein SAMN05216276_11176 [Streptosporangium subroseum]